MNGNPPKNHDELLGALAKAYSDAKVSGSQTAFARAFTEAYPVLCLLARLRAYAVLSTWRGDRREEAKEVASEVVAAIHRRMQDVPPELDLPQAANIRAYVRRAAACKAIDRLRMQKRDDTVSMATPQYPMNFLARSIELLEHGAKADQAILRCLMAGLTVQRMIERLTVEGVLDDGQLQANAVAQRKVRLVRQVKARLLSDETEWSRLDEPCQECCSAFGACRAQLSAVDQEMLVSFMRRADVRTLLREQRREFFEKRVELAAAFVRRVIALPCMPEEVRQILIGLAGEKGIRARELGAGPVEFSGAGECGGTAPPGGAGC